VANQGALIAIDLGHQRIHGAIVSFDTRTRLDEVVDLARQHDAGSDVETVTALVTRLLERAGTAREDVMTVCVGLHAPFDARSGNISPSAILPGWEGYDVRSALSKQLQAEVVVDNDANFAALAEWTWGAGRGTNDFFYVKSSEGIGSGLVINGAVYSGGNGMAGEIGHIVVDDRGAICNCGNRGCLSAVASGRALLLQLRAAGNQQASLQEIIGGARAGDAACARVLGEAGRYIGTALAHVVKVMAPSTIAVGGELASAGPLVFDGMRAVLAENSLRTVSPPVTVREGVLRNDVCILGCVAHVLATRGSGISDIPEWLLHPVGHRKQESA
jgi:predicted NBD/HSP70 family sugar kinase